MIEAEFEPPETYLIVMEQDGEGVHAMPEEANRVDAAIASFVASGGLRDELLSLTLSEGGEYHILASRLTGYWLSTPEHRRHNLMRQKWIKDEKDAMRAEIGMEWEA